jgi:hypothetical protein
VARSADPVAELPGLILAIDRRHGPVTQIMLGRAGRDASLPGCAWMTRRAHRAAR